MNRYDFMKLVAGGCLSILFTALVFGPMGGGRRYVDQLQQRVRADLAAQNLDRVDVLVEHDPILRRSVVLSGAVEQRERVAAIAISRRVPGVAAVRWVDSKGASGSAPSSLSTRYGQQSY